MRGTTRPNIISFIIWTLLQLIAIAAQLSAGSSWSVIILIACTFNTVLIIILCLVGYGYAKYKVLDWSCFILAMAAILLWCITNDPLLAIGLAIFADFLGALPTVVKAFRDPFSELPLGWYLATFSAVLAALSTTKIDFANLAYPVYLVIITATIASVALVGQRLKKALI